MLRLIAIFLSCLVWSQVLLGQSPRIDLIDPAQGPIAGGTVVTVTGANFQGASLTVDKVATATQVISATTIRFTTAPHDNGIASVKVANATGAAYGEFLFVPPKLKDLPPGYITTVAGIGTFTGYYRQAMQAEIQLMGSPAFDQSGNLYFAEPGRNRISRVRPDGVIEPFAGTGISAFLSGRPNVSDSGPATEMALNYPRGVTTDSSGYVYFTDSDSRLHRVDTRTGIITTIAGNGTAGFSGDGGPAVRAQLFDSTHITGDGNGTIFFIDFDDAAGFGRIRKITPNGTISTVAGVGPSGFSGDGGPATQAQFNFIYSDRGSLALDSNGNLFIEDAGNSRIRRVDAQTGIVTTVRLHQAAEWVYLAADRSGNIYFNEGPQILKMGPTGQIIATYGLANFPFPYMDPIDGTPINSAAFLNHGLAIDPSGNIVYMETNRVRRLNLSTGLLETMAGMGWGIIGDNGPGVASTLAITCEDIAVLPSGDLLIGDGAHQVVRKLDGNGDISVFSKGYDYRVRPNFIGLVCAIEPDGAGNVYLSDTYNIFRIDAKGVVSLLAGKQYPWVFGYSGDGGLATDALLCQPWDVALDGAGNAFIADTNNNRIRRIDARTGIITTVAGSGPVNGFEHYDANGHGSFSGDGGPALQACLNTPCGVVVDSKGNLFIADGGNNRIRKVDPSGIISTFVDNVRVSKMVFDRAGNLFGAANGGIFRFDQAGHSTQIARLMPMGFSGDGGPATQAQARASGQSTGIAIDSEGNVFFLDNGNYRVRAIRFGALVAPSAIATHPVSQTIGAGDTVAFSVAATGLPTPTYQWLKNGVNISGATSATLVLSGTTGATAALAGSYSCRVTNSLGTAVSTAATLSVISTNDPGRLINLSVNTGISAASPDFTVGTVIGPSGASGTKALVVRADGPSLGALGVPGTLADPQLTFFNSSSVAIASNDNWGTPVGFGAASAATMLTAMANVGAFAFTGPTSLDAAVYQPSLTPGGYTVKVSGVNGSTGTALAELYDATPGGTYTPTSPKLINVSVSQVIPANGSLTLGFTIGGSTARTVLIRVIGVGLSALGINSGTLADPQLTVYNSSSQVIATNDDWGADPQLVSAGSKVGAFSIGSTATKDAMLLLTLPVPPPQGAGYTAKATGNGGTGGFAIVEVYEVP